MGTEPYEFNGTRQIFKDLKKKGYSGSIGSVYRFIDIWLDNSDNKIYKDKHGT